MNFLNSNAVYDAVSEFKQSNQKNNNLYEFSSNLLSKTQNSEHEKKSNKKSFFLININ